MHRAAAPGSVTDGLGGQARGVGDAAGGPAAARGGVLVGPAVGRAVEAADLGALLVAVGAHVWVLARLGLAAVLLDVLEGGRLGAEGFLADAGPDVVGVHAALAADNTAAAELRGRGRARERGAVGALAPEHGGLVLGPVALPEAEAAVLGPEEEPDAGEHHARA